VKKINGAIFTEKRKKTVQNSQKILFLKISVDFIKIVLTFSKITAIIILQVVI